jgi:MerR family copper efflux transcriptional regulator
MRREKMNIGDVARLCGLPPKTIRYYEDIGLVQPQRSTNGYRSFCETDLHKLAFLARARTLGFTIEDCRVLLALYEDDSRESASVKSIAKEQLTRIDDKIAQLNSMRTTLAHLIDACAGDHRPDCPILDDLGGPDSSGNESRKNGEDHRV